MMKNRKLKGFTLMELIIVIAIIAVLAAILAPTMSTYYRSSRLKEENTNARMIYNAAQTEMQRAAVLDRTASAPTPFSGALIIAYDRSGTITTTDGASLESALVSVAGTANETAITEFVEEVNQLVSDADQNNWIVCIENYVVKGTFTAQSNATNYVGRFSSNNASDESSGATDASTLSYGNLVLNGRQLADFAEQFYGLETYTPAPVTPP